MSALNPANEGSVWLGIDVGTGGCRVMAADGHGRVGASAISPLRSVRRKPGWHEQDVGVWTAAVAKGCNEVLRAVPPDRVGAVAICGTSGTILLADRRGAALTPAVMYDDIRAVDTDRTTAVIEAWHECSDRNGYRVQPTWALPKLAWLLDHVDAAESAFLAHCGDYIGGWLAGHPVATDTSHALKSGYDLLLDQWPAAAFDSIGIPVSMLPDVVAPGSVVGVVGPAAADTTGLLKGTPIVAGMTDGCASQIAAGTVRAGKWNVALGTTFVLKGVADRLVRGYAIYSHRHPDGSWLPGGASNSGAGVLTAVFPGRDLADMDRAAATYRPTDVVRYPLARAGERFPFVQPDAEPFQLGSARDDGELFACLLQSVAFVERLSIAYMATLGLDVDGDFALTGGATRSSYWNQLHADVLGRAVTVPRHPDAAFGMAVLAAAKPGSVADAADDMVSAREVFEPQSALTSRYLPVYRHFVTELARRGYIDGALSAMACGS